MKNIHGKFVALVFSGEKAPSIETIPIANLDQIKKTPNEFQAVKDFNGNFHVIKYINKNKE